MSALRITEIFLSLQGEANTVGKPTVFVRLTGCPLRCHYCDSAYAFSGGELIEEADILNTVKGFGVQHVTVTGGEPLAQPGALSLMVALADAGLSVSIETSGALSVAEVDPRVVKVLDLKTPGSGEVQRNLWENMRHLNAHDQIKFVVCDRADYDWARMRCDEHNLYAQVADVLFSPSHHQLASRDLADWIVADRLPVRMQVQLHKLLWGDVPGR
ncbi:MAG: 7-carboxy-7-deazaguanine synthase QueE [Gammaproteobacteria bacterium]|jgi:7-carboxy-7-deazaguanine synthase|nr:7-carboxy-7-deazaguanine synthase QueE [Gammaproteobacteria bacterium]MDA8868429.1 7-carboxy-7-deazaguanine synthase QueE [Pseudomonadales bacterium]MBT3696559.1 7-carboxy-7-deazaguanine synthase QueE [Gammaproteobacteria bacterium]MBT5333442.1 7-carboxy-7-deazaguanine synthase QueE [Gammaproteobacteria bacterium]MBT5680948.1 7-carboxy-7-deazaguanine synthase QueE [Gammaproteobacteria bacterium]